MGVAAVPYIMAAAAVASAAVSYTSSARAGRAQKSAEQRAAEQAKAAAAREAADARKLHQRIIGAQEAKYGASGLTMEGSPLLVQHEAMKESKEQLRRIAEGGEILSSAYQASGTQAARAGQTEGIKSLLQGAQSVYSTGSTYDWW